MLIKNRQSNITAIFVSALIHITVLGLLLYPNLLSQLFPANDEVKPPEDRIIQVISVPPDMAYEYEKPPETTNYSDKSRTVEKETYTDTLTSTEAETPKAKKSLDNEKENELDKKEQKIVKDKIGLKKAEKEKTQTAKIFPSDARIGEILKDTKVESPKTGTGTTLSLNTTDLKYYKYLSDMKRRIEFYWEYPRHAIRRGEQGYINIDFTIAKDGKIKDVKVIQSSNYPALDDAAISAIRLANPFNEFPNHFEIEDLSIKGRFRYTLVGRGGSRR